MIVSTIFLRSYYDGLYEWPVDGLIMAGTSGFLYFDLTYLSAVQASSMG
jgi:hypothetical protein